MAANGRRPAIEASGIGSRIETLALSVLLLAIIVLAALQIVLRNFFSMSLFFADELIRIAVLWIAVIGGVAAARDGRHIAITIVPRYFPHAWHKPASVLACTFAAVISGTLMWHAFRFVADSRRFDDVILGDMPAWMFQAVMPIGFGLMCYHFVRHAIVLLRRRP